MRGRGRAEWTWRGRCLPCLAALAIVVTFPRTARAQDAWSGADKAMHFSASFVLAGGGYAVGAGAFGDRSKAVALGAGVSLATGLIKESLDLAGMGQASWRDVTWNVVGVAAGIGIAILLDLAARGLTPASKTTPDQAQGGLVWRF